MDLHDHVIDSCFSASTEVRYVAVYLEGCLRLLSGGDLQALGTNESDTYHELLVNPTLLKLLSQSGNIHCGGVEHLDIPYGQLHALVRADAGLNVPISLGVDNSLDCGVPPMLTTIDAAIFGFPPKDIYSIVNGRTLWLDVIYNIHASES